MHSNRFGIWNLLHNSPILYTKSEQTFRLCIIEIMLREGAHFHSKRNQFEVLFSEARQQRNI